MSNTDEDHIAEIGREQDVIRRVLLMMTRKRFSWNMLRDVPEPFVGAVTKFDVFCRKNLGRVGWYRGRSQPLVYSFLVLYEGRSSDRRGISRRRRRRCRRCCGRERGCI